MNVAYLILGLVLLCDAYWWRRSDRYLRALPLSRVWRVLLAAFMVGIAWLLVTRLLPPRWSRILNGPMPLALVAGQWLWHLTVLPICLGIGWAARGLGWVVSKLRRGGAGLGERSDPGTIALHPSRRQLLRAASVAVPPVLLAGATGVSLAQLGGYRVRSMDLRIPGLPVKLEGVVIAHLSDFHAGRFMTRANMLPIIDTVNDMRPDLVLVTGDLIDYALVDLPPALDALRRLKPKYGLKDGVAMCMGNHDVIEDRFTFKRDTLAAGFNLLVNDSRSVVVAGQPVELMAIDWCQGDLRTGEKAPAQTRASVRGLAEKRDPAAFPILLAHHPHAFDEAAAQALPLTLAGHTHGGQIMATERLGAGPMMFRYWSGLYRKPNGSQLVVSNGIGNWFPLRVNAPAEVLRLTLRRV